MRRQDALHRRISDTNFWPDTFEGDGGRVSTFEGPSPPL
jgi:hypothetical protein